MDVIRLEAGALKEAVKLSEYAFQYKVEEQSLEARLKRMEKNQQVYGIMDEGQLAAKLHLIPLHIYMEGRKLRMGGVAGVATYPEYRRSGYVKKLLLHSLVTMKEQGMTLSMLHPFSVSFYRKYGWELFADRHKAVIGKDNLIMQDRVYGRIRRYTKETYNGDPAAIYDTFAAGFSGMLARNEEWWLESVLDDLQAAVYYDVMNKPAGYMLYEVKDNKMRVEEFVPLHGEARKGLWNFICQHDSMITEAELTTFPQDPLFFTLNEPRVKAETKPYFMARIVDVFPFLQQYPFQWGAGAEAEVHLEIHDPFAEWNNMTVSVGKGEIAESDGVREPLKISIQALSALLLGYRTADELADMGAVTGPAEDQEKLKKLLPKQRPFFMDFF